MNAHASIASCAGRIDLRSEAPLVLRYTPEGVYLVGGAAGPLGGDDLTLDVFVGPGEALCVRSAAAQIALPGRGPSRFAVRATVASGGSLSWLPEPTIAANGCRHEIDVTLGCDENGCVVWREEVVLGREREPSGVITTRMYVDVGGRPVLRQSLRLGEVPGWNGPAVVGDAKAVGSVLVLRRAVEARAEAGAAAMTLAAGGVLVSAVAPDALSLRSILDLSERRNSGGGGESNPPSRNAEAGLLRAHPVYRSRSPAADGQASGDPASVISPRRSRPPDGVDPAS